MSKQNNFDKLFKDKLNDLEAEPSQQVWDNIAQELDSDGDGTSGSGWKRWLAAASLALLLIGGLSVALFNTGVQQWITGDSEHTAQQEQKQIVQNNDQATDQSISVQSSEQQNKITSDVGEQSQKQQQSPSTTTNSAADQSGSPNNNNSDEAMSAVQNKHNQSVTVPASSGPEKTADNSKQTYHQSSTASSQDDEKITSAHTQEAAQTQDIAATSIKSIFKPYVQQVQTRALLAASDSLVREIHQTFLASTNENKGIGKPEESADESPSHIPQGVFVGAITDLDQAWIVNENRFNQGGKMNTALNVSPSYGIAFGYNFSDKMALQGEWTLSEQGHRYEGNFTRDIQLSYSQFAALLRLRATKLAGKKALPVGNSITIGPYYSILRSAAIVDVGDPSAAVNKFKANDFGIVVGLEHERFLTKNLSLTIGVRGKMGTRNIGDNVLPTTNTSYYNARLGVHVGLKYLRRCDHSSCSLFSD